jgi:N-acetyl-1-D-myo-inositol-2-amino-2-deoxy-alpha-D-glucopyranoside deacetylase
VTDPVARPPRGLLAIFAHPDDESFGVGGVLALAAARGVPTNLVCATDGDLGGEAGARELDRELRRGELREAMAALGVPEPIFLGYRDSGMENWPRPADCFATADAEEVVGRLESILAELRPSVVLTFDPGGIYGHPDHVTISARATEAYRRAARR